MAFEKLTPQFAAPLSPEHAFRAVAQILPEKLESGDFGGAKMMIKLLLGEDKAAPGPLGSKAGEIRSIEDIARQDPALAAALDLARTRLCRMQSDENADKRTDKNTKPDAPLWPWMPSSARYLAIREFSDVSIPTYKYLSREGSVAGLQDRFPEAGFTHEIVKNLMRRRFANEVDLSSERVLKPEFS